MCPSKKSEHNSPHVICRFSNFEIYIGLCPTNRTKWLLSSVSRTITPWPWILKSGLLNVMTCLNHEENSIIATWKENQKSNDVVQR